MNSALTHAANTATSRFSETTGCLFNLCFISQLKSRMIMPKRTLVGLIKAAHLYGFLTKHCGKAVQSWVFDLMHASAEWNFDDKSPELLSALEDYSSGGAILLLGCGNASIVRYLKPNSFQYVLGVDISPEAISAANQLKSEKVEFQVGDIREFECTRKFNVILFAESIYYIKETEQERVLKRFCRQLAPNGCIIITVINPNGFRNLLSMVRTDFTVTRETCLKGSNRILIAFR